MIFLCAQRLWLGGHGSFRVWRSADYAVRTRVLGEFVEIHVSNREISHQAWNLLRDNPKHPTRFSKQIDNKDGQFGIRERHLVREEGEGVMALFWCPHEELLHRQPVVLAITDASKARLVAVFVRLFECPAKRLPPGVI